MTNFLSRRRAGLLLHLTSLPNTGGYGMLGNDACRFLDFLASAGMTVWQMLPTGPTHGDLSPYQGLSVHAGNPRFISIERLKQWGWLPDGGDLQREPGEEHLRSDALQQAMRSFHSDANTERKEQFRSFVTSSAHWLEDFALYTVIRKEQQLKPWSEWPEGLRDRHESELLRIHQEFSGDIEQVRFEQFVWSLQWSELRRYAREKDILLFGDMPIFVAYDSADVWSQREFFALNSAGEMESVAGVPPDYFSATGQRWGNPHYRWDRMREDGFSWWVQRLQTQLQLFDLIRVDHFRGFEAYWDIPAADETAENGHWVQAPGDALFARLQSVFPDLPLVAEDLGTITDEVRAMRDRFGLPGMKILQFAFDGGDDNPYLPKNIEPNSVAYTGTHDNDTTLGWFNALLSEQQEHVLLELQHPESPMPWALVETVMATRAHLAILPLQDVLELGSEHRLNTPGVPDGNWVWQFHWEDIPEGLAGRLRNMVHACQRSA